MSPRYSGISGGNRYRTDHDVCLYEIHKYMVEHPKIFKILQAPAYRLRTGPDLVAENLCMGVIEYIEVELDATDRNTARRIAQKARELCARTKKNVRLWLVSSSDKWVRIVKRSLKALTEEEGPPPKEIVVMRISPIMVGRKSFEF